MSSITDSKSGLRRRSLPARLNGLRHGDLLGRISILVLVVIGAAAVLGSLIAPHDPNAQDLAIRLQPPAWSAGGDLTHLLGTDSLGRDILSRLIAGARLDLLIGFGAAALELLIGGTLGFIAGYRGGRLDAFIMRVADVQMGFPTVLTVLLIILTFGSGVWTLILAISVSGWILFARLVRTECRKIRDEPYVLAARVSGMRGLPLVRRHVFPHLRGTLVTGYLMEVPRVMLSAAALSFLGIGVTPPDISWGLMIGDSQSIIAVAPWASVLPGLAIFITILALYVFASWAEPRIDPLRSREGM